MIGKLEPEQVEYMAIANLKFCVGPAGRREPCAPRPLPVSGRKPFQPVWLLRASTHWTAIAPHRRQAYSVSRPALDPRCPAPAFPSLPPSSCSLGLSFLARLWLTLSARPGRQGRS